MASEHGGLNYKALRKEGINPDNVIDFSVSVNPDPLPAAVENAFNKSNVTRYPDTDSSFLREIIAAVNEVPDESVLVVNGTSQGMYLIVAALLHKDDSVCIVEPTYSGYRDACSLKTDNIIGIKMNEAEEFKIDSERIIRIINKDKPALLWLCSPNNPSGQYLDERNFEAIRTACCNSGTLFILDEAYICFADQQMRYNPLRNNVITLRSMTKDFSIPGLRLGYIMADPSLILKIHAWQPEWSVSSPAQDAGIAAYAELEAFRESWLRNKDRRDDLTTGLQSLGLKVNNSSSNFLLVKVDCTENLKEFLWHKLILVRDCASFGLENTIRIAVRTEVENQKLLNCFREYLKK